MPRGRKPKILNEINIQHSENSTPVMVDFKVEKWPLSTVTYRLGKGQIETGDVIQRGYVWSAKQRSLFIHSIMCGYPIPQLVAIKEGKQYNLLDGKQRITTINMFCNDKFRLKDIPLIKYDDDTEDDYNGLKYSELPEDVRKSIESYGFNFLIFAEGTSKEEAEDIFYRFNNGTSLKSSDKNFAKAISKDKISSLIDHPIFEKAMTETAREKLAPRQTIINSYILLTTDDLSLDSGDVSKFLRENEITDENRDTLDAIFTRLLDISNSIESRTDPGTYERRAAKRILGRINIPVLVKFLSNHNDDDKNEDFLMNFYSGEKKATISDAYNDASQSGSGHLDSIQKRLNSLYEEYEKMK